MHQLCAHYEPGLVPSIGDSLGPCGADTQARRQMIKINMYMCSILDGAES